MSIIVLLCNQFCDLVGAGAVNINNYICNFIRDLFTRALEVAVV